MSRETPRSDYVWPALACVASTANVIGNAAAIANGDASDTPAFKTALAASALAAVAHGTKIAQIYSERSEQAQTWAQREEERRAQANELTEIVVQK